jgi:hypothetical protein
VDDDERGHVTGIADLRGSTRERARILLRFPAGRGVWAAQTPRAAYPCRHACGDGLGPAAVSEGEEVHQR